MIVVTRRPLTRQPTLGAALAAGTLLSRLDEALTEGTCPVQCKWAVGFLLHRGTVEITSKTLADAFVCWLRALCGRHFEGLICVEEVKHKESA